MMNHSHEFVIKAEIKIINTSKIPKGALLFSSRLSICLEMYKRENQIFKCSIKSTFQYIKNQHFRRPVQEVTTKSLGVTHSEISLGQLAPTK
jgi:late competence protein required for DNA uptake (superfamily II DNA/RNA helicase)